MGSTIYSEWEHPVHVIVDRDNQRFANRSKGRRRTRCNWSLSAANSGSAMTINVLRLWPATRQMRGRLGSQCLGPEIRPTLAHFGRGESETFAQASQRVCCQIFGRQLSNRNAESRQQWLCENRTALIPIFRILNMPTDISMPF
ncbi:hypothetical protein [Paraburkholderia phytofirmans]|uniref:hypothetical protein n=1 Tax=Paraburkholderia phytofirmans TaxID=261302 RepID=UPI0011DF0F20|nr:hypothetical protein [Paraburkholderia phytofirmans]